MKLKARIKSVVNSGVELKNRIDNKMESDKIKKIEKLELEVRKKEAEAVLYNRELTALQTINKTERLKQKIKEEKNKGRSSGSMFGETNFGIFQEPKKKSKKDKGMFGGTF